MAINLPHWLVEVIDILGFNWPEIDEDQLHEAARQLRRYADNCAQSRDATHKIVTGDLQHAYSAQSYTALAEAWGSQSRSHMQTLIEGCRLLADGLDLAAEGVVAMKGEVIGQLIAASSEVLGDQGLAVVTGGAAEAALPGIIALQNRILSGILQRFEAEVVGALVNKTIGPIRERIEEAVTRLLYDEVAEFAIGAPPPGLKLDTAAMRGHADKVREQADANRHGGRAFEARVTSLTYTTGG